MPEGIGKLRDRARIKFPRIFNFYERYHTTITALAIIVFVSAVAYIGLEQRATESTVTHVQRDVNVIKQNSPCTPRANGKLEHPIQCRQNFSNAIKQVTPIQACEVLQKGAKLITLGGKPIPSVRCTLPHPSRQGNAEEAERDLRTPSETNSVGSGSNEITAPSTGGSNGGSNHHAGNESGPGSSPGHGKVPHGSNGGSGPAGPVGTAPGGSGPPTSEQPASSSGGPVEEESEPPPDGGSSSSGPGKIVEGIGETVHEVTERICHINPLGLEVCLPL